MKMGEKYFKMLPLFGYLFPYKIYLSHKKPNFTQPGHPGYGFAH
jgi:hypothetical protein